MGGWEQDRMAEPSITTALPFYIVVHFKRNQNSNNMGEAEPFKL